MTIFEAFEYTIRKLHSDGMAEKTIRNYRSANNSLLDITGDIPIQLLTNDHVLLWKEEFLRRCPKGTGINRHLSCLRVVLSEMQELRLNVISPRKVGNADEKPVKQSFVTPSEVQAMIDVAENPRDKAMPALLFSLGCRPSEMLNLNREDVQKDDIMITNDKTGHDYAAFIAPYARRLLDEYLETRTDRLRPLFISGQCRRLSLYRLEQILHVLADLSKQEYPEAWQRDKNVTPYSFRRGHGTDLWLNGADIVEVQKALGHKNIQHTQRYVMVPDERHRQVRERYHTKLK